ncbi:DNA replication checkpoint protein tel2 [Vanrija pseudolonga]|uniref:DNA replication checkpoint protein tel2 n=1 Tax=Vanrija pseudolonga TaxID=143232 RepID=A0AAF0YDK4_9TREE|nr:DNA replication checkpoint protein tel2 [Vanrija pseudolonga]
MPPDDAASAALRSLRDALRASPPDADSFVFLLSSTLDNLGLSPTSIAPASGAGRAIARQLPAVQQALLSTLPTFLPALDARGRALVDSFFVPAKHADQLPLNRSVALVSYLNLSGMLAPAPPAPLPAESRAYVLDTLAKLPAAYGIDDVYWATWGHAAAELAWDDGLRALAALPGKVANAVGRWREAGWTGDVPGSLVPRAYFDSLVRRLESLSYELAQAGTSEPQHLRQAYAKLAGLGLLTPPTVESGPTPAFFPPFLPPALGHLHPADGSPLPAYPGSFFPAVLLPLPTSTLATLADSLAQHVTFRLASPSSPLEPDVPDERVCRAAVVVAEFLGPASVGSDAWAALLQTLLRSAAGEEVPKVALRRSIVAWAAGGGSSAARQLIDRVMDVWSDTKQIKFGLYGQLFGLTHTLILALSLLPQYDPYLIGLAGRAQFMQAVQAFLSHPDPKIRRLGMLVAEILSELTIVDSGEEGPTEEETMAELQADLEDDSMGEEPRKRNRKPVKARRLKFTGMWDGSGDGKDECRWLRGCLGVKDADAVLTADPSGTAWLLGWDRDVEPEPEVSKPSVVEMPSPKLEPRGRKHQSRPKIIMLDDDQAADPLEGYAESDPGSSRSPSPTPSFLEEVAADPTLAIDATKKKKLKRPVYVRQLVELLRDKEKPESIEMGLEWGEGLIRAKRNFGGEVVENAVDVAQAAISLSDPYHLDDFEKKRQGLVTALVACSPRNVPPFLAEQYFSASYSLLQKSVMLTALAMGARELAGLPFPDPPRTTRRVDFPSKTLPPALHKKYITPQDQPQQGQLEDAAADMRNLLLSKGARQGEETVPELARQRRLRVGEPARPKVAVEGSLSARQMGATPAQRPVAAFSSVAAEFFILPLINRFWEYFQDASVRETRAIASGGRYRGAGTGLVLSPMALEKFLLTLALLIHAARHAPTFLAVLAPAALELATTVGARHQATPDLDGEVDNSPQAQVVSAALGLALAVLDTAVELDKGRTFALDAPALVLGAGEWAHAVFEAQSSGERAAGGREGRLRAAAAGVVVKVAEIGEAFGGLGGVGR